MKTLKSINLIFILIIGTACSMADYKTVISADAWNLPWRGRLQGHIAINNKK